MSFVIRILSALQFILDMPFLLTVSSVYVAVLCSIVMLLPTFMLEFC